jgi:energy-coupling factor transporter ATP-binding protein EcfA2
MHRQPGSRGPLDAAELAEAAVLGDLALVLIVAGWFLPYGTVLFLMATIPYAVLVARRRSRAALVAGGATGMLAFVLGGVNMTLNLVAIAAVGSAVGIAYRRGWKRLGTVTTAIGVVWVPAAILTVVGFTILKRSRELTLEQVHIATRGPLKFFSRIGFESASTSTENAIQWAIDHWYIALPIAELVIAIAAALFCRRVALPALRRIDATFEKTAIEHSPTASTEESLGAVPVTLRGVGYRYPGASRDAIAGVHLTIEPGSFVAVVGNNGSGKSTLASIVAGFAPTAGTVERAGGVGIGRIGGTARVFQRPESQVLGARVADDIRWGLARATISDAGIDELLTRVGLEGFAMRDTATLSGGELQRLAIASALARRPGLLVSDESTAMLDPDGRATVVAALRAAVEAGTTVVHVTHEPQEAAQADVVVHLDDGRVEAIGSPADVLAARGESA